MNAAAVTQRTYNACLPVEATRCSIPLCRGRKGFLSRDEFLNIPEVSINPLCTRLVRFFAGVNFKEFANLVSVFTARATREDKVKFMFSVHDMDGDGVISTDDLRLTIQVRATFHLAGRRQLCLAREAAPGHFNWGPGRT